MLLREEMTMETLWNKMALIGARYIISDEGLATILILFIIVLKLLINQRVTKLHFKKTIIAIPSEITFLVIGFLLSSILGKHKIDSIRSIIATIWISLVLLVIQYALERYLDDKLSGNWDGRIWSCVIFMYISTVILYGAVVFGGTT